MAENLRVMLDAGHYASRNQSPVVPEYWESKQMWKLHLMLKTALEAYGIEVGVTRTDPDKDLEVTKRGKQASGYDLFLSLHSNAYGTESVDRVDVYASYDNQNGSHTFAELLGKAIAECMDIAESYVKTRKSEKGDWEYYGVLRGARAAGCPMYYIVEHSFHTNKRSAEWLLDDNNLKNLAETEAKCIAEYFGIEKPQPAKAVKTVTVTLEQLSKGSKGEQVKNLQLLLDGKGYSCGSSGADGIFGSKTEQAVVDFQTANGLAPDGICGKNTWRALLNAE